MLRDVAVMLADGACLSDLQVLASQQQLWGKVASVATAWRTVAVVAADELGGVDALRAARATAMGWAWQQAGGPPLIDGMLVVDGDATHVIAHSEKVGAAGTYKGRFGFYPLLGYIDHGPDACEEPIAGLPCRLPNGPRLQRLSPLPRLCVCGSLDRGASPARGSCGGVYSRVFVICGAAGVTTGGRPLAGDQRRDRAGHRRELACLADSCRAEP